MARKLAEIKKELTGAFVSNSVIQEIYGLSPVAVFDDEFSKVSLENILFDVFAFSVFVLEKLFDTHKKEIDDKLANQKSGTLAWYRTMALRFQYGFDLVPDRDYFDNKNATDEQIKASKIIKYAAVLESQEDSRVIIKIAGENASKVLCPINGNRLETFKRYIREVRYAGVRVTIISYLPDRLNLTIEIYRDALIIDAKGSSILNGNKPVEDAIKEFMKELPFNGELVLEHLVDKLQAVEGVRIPNIVAASSSWIDKNAKNQNDYAAAQLIYVKKIPESGYFEIVNFNNITYVV